LEQDQVNEPFSNLAYHAIVAARHHQLHGADKLDQAGNGADFLTRAIRRAIDEETARLESGLMVLASIGSTAPFVGLFGTVWGVYHALIAIGASLDFHGPESP
jgi:biopolymer transport protein ExbB